jgi:site-specific recombinase XerC
LQQHIPEILCLRHLLITKKIVRITRRITTREAMDAPITIGVGNGRRRGLTSSVSVATMRLSAIRKFVMQMVKQQQRNAEKVNGL